MNLRIGSLCTGVGGLDLAIEAHYGATPAWFAEFDPAPSKVLAHHWPDVPNHGDVWHTDWTAVEPVDVLTAGYPCQPFSYAGKRKGTDDPRHLWPGVAHAIGVLRPRLVVLENVRGHLSLGLADVLGDLSALGYDARWGVVRAADVGAPHGRARIFIVAEPAADAGGGSLAGPAAAGHGLRVAAERGDITPADPSRERHGRGVHAGDVGRVDGADAGEARQRERARSVAVDRGAAAPPDAEGERSGQAVGGLGTGQGELSRGASGGVLGPLVWGDYAPAIHRWEHVLGRPAPAPTEPGRDGRPRLSPVFVEWMMGLPAGHVTDVPGLSRNAQFKALGNGVVPQQAAYALRLLDEIAQVAA